MELQDLPRNDVPAAVAWVKAVLAERKRWPAGWELQSLLMLQDDPAALEVALDDLERARRPQRNRRGPRPPHL